MSYERVSRNRFVLERRWLDSRVLTPRRFASPPSPRGRSRNRCVAYHSPHFLLWLKWQGIRPRRECAMAAADIVWRSAWRWGFRHPPGGVVSVAACNPAGWCDETVGFSCDRPVVGQVGMAVCLRQMTVDWAATGAALQGWRRMLRQMPCVIRCFCRGRALPLPAITRPIRTLTLWIPSYRLLSLRSMQKMWGMVSCVERGKEQDNSCGLSVFLCMVSFSFSSILSFHPSSMQGNVCNPSPSFRMFRFSPPSPPQRSVAGRGGLGG